MALNIRPREADRLARELAGLTGESITEAVTQALRSRLERCRDLHGRNDKARRQSLKEELELIRKRAATYPILDTRSDDEILG